MSTYCFGSSKNQYNAPTTTTETPTFLSPQHHPLRKTSLYSARHKTTFPTQTPLHRNQYNGNHLHNPTAWIYTDGSLKKEKTRLGTSVIHSPTSTITYIDASGQEVTHINTRAKIVNIHVALAKYKNAKWIGIFTDSQISLHAILNQVRRPSHTPYYPRIPLIAAIITTLPYRASLDLHTN